VFDFPANPNDGQIFAPPGGPIYVFRPPVWMAHAGGLPVVVKGYIHGMITNNDAGDLVNDIGITAGECASSQPDPALIVVSTAFVKRLDAAWAPGGTPAAPVGGLDTGVVADGTYHLYALYRSDTGQTDYCFSASPVAPTVGGAIPAAYDHFRRIWSIVRIAGTNQGYLQDGDDCWLKAPVSEASLSNPGTAAVLLTMSSIPAGINVLAKMTGYGRDARLSAASSTFIYLSDPSLPAVAPGAAAITVFFGSSGQNEPNMGSFQIDVRTNTARQIRYQFTQSASTSTTGQISCNGWRDTRGK
jgi:hypothetical protein